MESPKEQTVAIRRYLLDQLDEEVAEDIDEKIITDLDFYEEVLMIEQDLLQDYLKGELTDEENQRVKFFYESSESSRKKMTFAQVLKTVAETGSQTEKSFAAAVGKTDSVSFKDKIRNFLGAYPRLIPAVFGLIIIVGTIFIFFNIFSSDRTAIERDLAQINSINTNEAINRRFGQTLYAQNLKDESVRGTTAADETISISEASGKLIHFQLSLLVTYSENYQATFLDKDNKELFSVINLRPEIIDEKPQINILVPAKYFEDGNYKINLQAKDTNNDLIKAGVFTFQMNKK